MSSTLISPRRMAQEAAVLLFKHIGKPHHKFMDGTSPKTDDSGGFYSENGERGLGFSYCRVLAIPNECMTYSMEKFSDTFLAPVVRNFVEDLPRGAEWNNGAAAIEGRDVVPGAFLFLIRLSATMELRPQETLDTPARIG